MRNDFGTRPYKPRFPYSKGSKKQGYLDKEAESVAMRIKKKRTPAELKASVDESYGKWGNRKKDWKKS